MKNILSKIQEETLQHVLQQITPDDSERCCLCKKTVFVGCFMKKNKVIKESFDLKFSVKSLKNNTVSLLM